MGNGEAGSLETLLDGGWARHDRESASVAQALEAAADKGVAPGLLPQFLHLSTHTIGEHLGDWPRALSLGQRVLHGLTPTAATARAWGRLYVAAVLAGDSLAATEIELSVLNTAADAFGTALLDMRFMLVSALVGSSCTGEAVRIFRSALAFAGTIPPSPLLDRTIAVAGNNLGWELYEMPARAAEDDAMMQLCADTGLVFWRKAGDWINEERALYLTAVVANATGHPQAGLADADAALAIIAAHGERPLDAARLHLTRAASFAALGDSGARARALVDADVAAAKLSDETLRAQYAAERIKALEKS